MMTPQATIMTPQKMGIGLLAQKSSGFADYKFGAIDEKKSEMLNQVIESQDFKFNAGFRYGEK